MNWCILIPLLVGLISAILGYLLGRLLGNSNNDDKGLDVYKNRVSKLEADLLACRESKSSSSGSSSGAGNSGIGSANIVANLNAVAETDNSNTKNTSDSSVSSGATATTLAESGVAFNSDLAKSIFGKKIKENDLTVVEGIGPKIKELFHGFDVTTWAKLADCSVDKCKEVLKSGGKRFEMHKPDTWPSQSKLAAEGKWQELKDLQDRLDGGK